MEKEEFKPKTLSIKEHTYEKLFNQGFRKAKSCGIGVQGFKVAFAIGYLEGLILKKDFHSNNIIFLYPL
jgi:hypothetical protein